MSTITIVASILAKTDNIELVKSELLKLITITRAEPGCLQYDLHQDNNNPAQFVFYENWASKALLQTHLESQHIASYVAATQDAVEKFVLNEMTKIA
ncbi:putative quinol monooxygenase [Psychromonas sp. Urea-02u-13]|uniref:putative quinol monooxygenase n=1 Tax=Psychromonas sp. Urea-02u-13 TaxID=2058326 RepID=UPI000C31EB9F|nr:putative quinol monooxygenase [Psychromonas sp. Urea-02u-13]PKG37161.1 antibiotic biosynthesis monooxygenase [Psychromonas sp. Urea-02u-13]